MRIQLKKQSSITALIVTISLIAVLVALFQVIRQPSGWVSKSVGEGTTATNLGFTYLQITPRVADFYNLRVESGALVTEVIPGSPADGAGVRVGDIILSFNGAQVEDTNPLLGMMMSCPIDHIIEMEMWREEKTRKVLFIHSSR